MGTLSHVASCEINHLHLRPIYTVRQSQCCDDASDTSLIKNNRVAPNWGCNLLFSVRAVSLASLQR